jgi:cell division protein FtsQ
MKNTKTIVTIVLSAIVLIAIVALATTEWVSNQEIGEVVVNLDESGNHFVDETGLRKAILEVVEESRDSVTNKIVDLALLEKELLRYSFVKEVQASRDIRGNLVIDVQQDEPIARVMATSGKGAYISRERNLLPLSKDYTARVMLITGSGADSLLSETFLKGVKGNKISKLIDYVNSDDFLASQITQLEISKWMGITLHPQVGHHRIEFGKAEDFDRKFAKLNTFYEEIVPKKGWNEYKTVKLQFEGQIVCK